MGEVYREFGGNYAVEIPSMGQAVKTGVSSGEIFPGCNFPVPRIENHERRIDPDVHFLDHFFSFGRIPVERY